MPNAKPDPFKLCGTTIDGKYRVLSVVGEGGFGVVYRGLHEGFDVPIAVKCLKLPPHFDLEAQDELVEKLREEGRFLLRLSQRTPGIVQALDVGSFTSPGGARVPYLILEWLEGRTLADELRARRSQAAAGMTLQKAIALLTPAAQALAVAHAERVAHRDIKPENLFLIDQGGKRSIKILDFGIAKVLADAPSPAEASTSASPATFTPAYGAPEQFDKKRGASGPWTDVFALALVLVEVVAGKRALEGGELIDFFRSSTDPAVRPTLRTRGVQTDDAVERALAKALHVEPRARYASADDFWSALSAAAERTPDAARAAAAPSRADDVALATADFASAEGIAFRDPTAPGASRLDSEADAAAESPARGGEGREANSSPAAKEKGRGRTEASPGRAADPTLPPAAAAGATTTKGGVVAAAISTGSASSSRRSRWFVLGALAVAFAGIVAAGLRTHWSPASPVTPPEPRSSASASEEPAPISKSAEAQALYAEARQAWRSGAPDDAVYALEQAVARDRELSAAHLRLALWKFSKRPIEAREHYDLASRHKASLGDQDARLLQAAEPMLREPWDLGEYEKRLASLAAQYPTEVELWVYLGGARIKRLLFDAALEALDRAIALDRGAVAAWVLKAECLSMKGDPQGQLEAYRMCLENTPRALQCQLEKISLRGRLGDCAGMRDDAKRLLLMNPKSSLTQKYLAMALYATGDPRESVVEALGRGWTFRPDAERKATELGDRSVLAVLDGDFEAAARLIEAWRTETAEKPDQDRHASPALELAKVYREMGRLKRAGEVADDFTRRMSAWTEPPLSDWTIAFLPFRLWAGSISREAFERGRAEWAERFRAKWTAAGRRPDTDLDWLTWSNGYGAPAETESEAREAIATMPRELSPVMATGRWMAVDLNRGKTYVLAGEHDKALEPLRRAARSCSALVDPMSFVLARFYLGMALEGTGSVDGARAAYGEVLTHWGKARPKSVTAERAKARLKALGEKKRR